MTARPVTRGAVIGARIKGGRVLVDVALLDGERRQSIDLQLPAGLTILPANGAEVTVLEVGGNRHHLVALLADDPTLRITGLAPGEFGFRDGQGQQVVFRGDRVEVSGALRVDIATSGPVNVTAADTVTVEAPLIRLGAGASQPVKLADDSPATKVHAE